MEPARNAARGFFPLDEELDLDDSDLTPRAQEGLVRLATWVPFGPAAQLLRALLGVQVSKASARRFTLQAGEAALQEWEQQTEELQRLLPEPLELFSLLLPLLHGCLPGLQGETPGAGLAHLHP